MCARAFLCCASGPCVLCSAWISLEQSAQKSTIQLNYSQDPSHPCKANIHPARAKKQKWKHYQIQDKLTEFLIDKGRKKKVLGNYSKQIL